MVRFIWLLILVAILYRVIRGLFGSGSQGSRGGDEGEEMVQDPRCGVYLPKSSAVLSKRAGKKLYFCSEECKEKFMDETKD